MRARSRTGRSERRGARRRGQGGRAGRRGAEGGGDWAGDRACAHVGRGGTVSQAVVGEDERARLTSSLSPTPRSSSSEPSSLSPHPAARPCSRPHSNKLLRRPDLEPTPARANSTTLLLHPPRLDSPLAMQPVKQASQLFGVARRSAATTARPVASHAGRRTNSTFRPPTPPSGPRPSVKQVGQSRPDTDRPPPPPPQPTSATPASPSTAPSRPAPSELLTVLEETIKVRPLPLSSLSIGD